jgi:phosphoribosylglycinamide formyltransferase-1
LKRISFLCSGGGGTLRFIAQCIRQGILPGFELSGVVADRDCPAIEWARKQGLRASRIKYSRDSPQELRRALGELSTDWVVLGFHKILDADTTTLFPGLINLHYSLLPQFGGTIGLQPVRQALEAGLSETGTTVHRVIPAVDCGPVISQNIVSFRPGETFESLTNRVFQSGCLNLLNALYILRGRTGPEFPDPSHSFKPRRLVDPAFFNEAFWETLR